MKARKRKGRPVTLDKLTPDQRDVVFAHCEYVTVADGILWLEAEFGVRIGSGALSRWLRKERGEREIAGKGRKRRPVCLLEILSPAQQRMIEEHCEGLTPEEGVQWLKEEKRIELSTQALGNWLRMKGNEKAYVATLERIRDNSHRATLVTNVFGAAASLTDASNVMIAQVVFEELNKKPEERDEKRLAQFMKLALQGRSVSLARERFQFDAAKRAREHAAELQEINEGEGDETEKLEKAMILLFGEEPIGYRHGEDADFLTDSSEGGASRGEGK